MGKISHRNAINIKMVAKIGIAIGMMQTKTIINMPRHSSEKKFVLDEISSSNMH